MVSRHSDLRPREIEAAVRHLFQDNKKNLGRTASRAKLRPPPARLFLGVRGRFLLSIPNCSSSTGDKTFRLTALGTKSPDDQKNTGSRSERKKYPSSSLISERGTSSSTSRRCHSARSGCSYADPGWRRPWPRLVHRHMRWRPDRYIQIGALAE